MKTTIITLISIIAFSSNLFAQNSIDQIIIEVEKNNTTLSAFRKKADAEKIGNRTGVYLQNPEVAFNYLLGNPSNIGNRIDFSIGQTFDFPTAYVYRNQISDFKNKQVALEYQKHRKSILLQTRLVCADLIYINALRSEHSIRLLNAQKIANLFKLKFEVGEANILEYNKAQVNLLNLSNDVKSIEIERNTLLSKLASLNGGVFIDLRDTAFQLQAIAPDFEQWYIQAEQNNPVLKWLKQEIAISQEFKKLNIALSLPKFQLGYMIETVVGQEFQGAKLGLTIPLWEDKNKVKYAKARSVAIQSAEADAKLQFYKKLKAYHAKAISLQNNVNNYRKNLQLFNSYDLLQQALDKGEISLLEYIMELSIYYKGRSKLLEMERDINKTIAKLNQYN